MRVPKPETDLTKEQICSGTASSTRRDGLRRCGQKNMAGRRLVDPRERFIFEQETSRAGTLPPLAFSVTMVGP